MSRLPDKVSDAFKRLNPSLYANDLPPQSTGENSIMERPARNAMGKPACAKEKAGCKFFVRVTSFRHRLLDEDNICEKYHVDLCRYAGILPSDAPGQTRIVATQEKIRSDEEEYTLVEIDREDTIE